jgi:hypothetical protein
MKTEIKAVIDVPDGLEYDRVDVETRPGDLMASGEPYNLHSLKFEEPTVIFRKKKPQTRWARMYKSSCGGIKMVAFVDKEIRCEMTARIGNDLIEWVGDWQEYEV